MSGAAASPDAGAPAGSADRARSRWLPARHEVIWLVVLCVGVRAIAAAANPSILRDSVGLLASAETVGREGLAALPHLDDHPLVPWLVATFAARGGAESFATWLAVVAGGLAVWPLHVLARRACGRHAATAACIVYAALPKAVGVASVPLTTPVLLPLFLGSLALAVSAGVPAPGALRWGRAAGAGVVAGLACLTRPEGYVAAAAVAGILLTHLPRGWRLRGAAAALVALVLVAGPYVAALSDAAGGPSLSPKKDVARFVGAADAPADEARRALAGAIHDTASALEVALTGVGVLLAVIGVFPLRRGAPRRSMLPRAALVATAFAGVALVVRLNLGWGYGGARHVLPAALLLLPFAGEGLHRLSGFLGRVTSRRRMVVVLAAALAVPMAVRAVLRPEGASQEPQRLLGQALGRAAAARPDGGPLVVASFQAPLVAYYAGRELPADRPARDVPLWGAHRALLELRVDAEGQRAALVATLRREGAQWLVLDLFRSERTATGEVVVPGARLAERLRDDGAIGLPVLAPGGELVAFPVR